MLDFESTLVRVKHINNRIEKHSDDKVLGVDLRLVVRLSNNELAQFSPTLKASFYHKDDSVQGDVVTDANHLPNLKNPQIGPIKWEGDWEHRRLAIHHGTRAQDDIVLGDAKVSKVVLDLQEGGTVFVTFRVQCHPDEKQAAKLLTLLDQEVHMSLSVDDDADLPMAA